MHNYVANSGRKALLKQIFSVFLIFTLYFNSFNSAYASTSLGGWSLGGAVAQGASTVYEGTKKVIIDGKNYLKKGSALITPNATQVAKTLAKGAAGYALTFAVQELLGAVDWVLDPANNQIKYWDEPGNPYYLGEIGSNPFGEGKTREEACQNYASSYQQKFGTASTVYYYSTVGIQGTPTATSAYWCYLNKMVYSTVYDNSVRVDGKINLEELGQTDGEVKTYPLPAIADFLINKAEQGNTTAQGATLAAAADIVAEAETDDAKARPIVQQLEATATTTAEDSLAQETANEAKGETKPNETGGTDLSLQFPTFCGWAPLVCEAAQSVIKFPTTVSNWWTIATTSISDAWTWTKARYESAVTSISDFFKNEPDQTDNSDLPVQEIPLPQLETNAFTATAGCPEPIPIQVKIGVEGTAYISYEPICQFASKWSFVVPLICFLSGAMIIVGVGRKGEDSEI